MSSGPAMTDSTGRDQLCEVTLIGGFLGSGKTTLLRRILGWPGDLSSTAVLVNEFGKIGIDGDLLQGTGTPVVELTNGCICCTIQGDLLRTVTDVLDRFAPKRLLIEATGVADPKEILVTLRQPRFQDRLSVQKVVTVLDADFWKCREILGPLFYNQIRAADLVLLNKVDLLPPEDIPLFLREIQDLHPPCAVVPTLHCQIDPYVLWRGATLGEQEAEGLWEHEHAAHETADDMGFVAFAFEEDVPFQEDRFRQFMGALPPQLYRVKGFAHLGERRYFVNHVGGKTEWVEKGGSGPTRLAFVGWNVEGDEVLEKLRACLSD